VAASGTAGMLFNGIFGDVKPEKTISRKMAVGQADRTSLKEGRSRGKTIIREKGEAILDELTLVFCTGEDCHP